MYFEKIVTGGQTGVDRAAWDAALEFGIEIGGWVPRERWAEDGRISAAYQGVTETRSKDPSERTEFNVRDSDGTLIISRGGLSGGSALTRTLCEEIDRPVLHIDLSNISHHESISQIKEWLKRHAIRILNIAGPRASEDPEIYSLSKELLGALFSLTPKDRR